MKAEKTNKKKQAGKVAAWEAKDMTKEMITASYFGFIPTKTPDVSKDDHSKLRSLKDPYYETDRIHAEYPFSFDALEKIALFRSYLDWGIASLPHPVLMSYRKPVHGTEHKKGTDSILGLEAFGLSGSAAEALLLRSALSILEDLGFKNLCIEINSIGDKESVADLERATGTFVRKNINAMSAEERRLAKKDVFDLLRTPSERSDTVPEVPKSISFLSENSRIHFKEVLEYIESFNTPYTINSSLIGSPCFCSETTFKIMEDDGKNKQTLALGYRYSRLSKKIGFKKELPAMGVTISLDKKDSAKLPKKQFKPKFYLIQLGLGAKMRALEAIEVLRHAKIPVAFSLGKDKFQSQLGSAENMKVPYVLIIGQKEAIENSIVIRDMNTRVQETVEIKELPDYIRKLK
jgi:histidyl-tRNA synthetase